MNDVLKDLLVEYQIRFGKPYPVFECDVSRESVEMCLNTGTPADRLYEIEYEDIVY